MFDYSKIIDDNTKKNILLDRYENQRERILGQISERVNEPSELISYLEGLVETLEDFITENSKTEE